MILSSFYIESHGQILAATDGLGRVIPQNGEVGLPKPNKHVALFYFLWQGDASSPISGKRWDLHEMWTNTPAIFNHFDDKGWGSEAGAIGKYYYWGQPIYGYYHGADYWVHLKNMQLLTDAGVDLLVLDATNRITYPQQAEALMQAIEAINKQGRIAPKIAFYTNTQSGETMQELYNNCYREGAKHRHPDCWFYLDGKPLIIGLSKEAAGHDYASFFTIRESQWPNEPQKINGWPWIEFVRPQKIYTNSAGEPEIVNVSTAQHPNLEAAMGGSAFFGKPGNWGRSYHDGKPGNPEKDVVYGYNIQEQWDYALQQNVPFIFVTGWNEWVAGKWRRNKGDKNKPLFVDQASPEYSRDLEPTLTAGLEDHYYMQLVSNIRKYKGIEPLPTLSPSKTIRTWSDWESVYPVYNDYTGDVIERHYRGAPTDPPIVYNNTTGRNDFSLLKVAEDGKQVYFYAETVSDITPNSGSNWMTLWIDADRLQKTGWHGYDYRVIAGNQLQHYTKNQWQAVGKVAYQTSGNHLMLSIPRKNLYLPAKKINLEFKWTDNMQDATPLDWYVNGDAAPGARFNFVAIQK
ncbi:hypothetical protein SAMN05216436_12168 [bacterium A37T11]|nr:hypothetical protein SAMN05216436_12168 [bacterium A37T11]